MEKPRGLLQIISATLIGTQITPDVTWRFRALTDDTPSINRWSDAQLKSKVGYSFILLFLMILQWNDWPIPLLFRQQTWIILKSRRIDEIPGALDGISRHVSRANANRKKLQQVTNKTARRKANIDIRWAAMHGSNSLHSKALPSDAPEDDVVSLLDTHIWYNHFLKKRI